MTYQYPLSLQIFKGVDVDFTATGVTNLFITQHNLHVIGICIQGIDQDTVGGAATFNIGTNSPNFDDIFLNETSGIVVTDACHQRFFNGTGCPIVPGGTQVAINITIAATPSVTNIQRVDVLGYYK